MDFVLKLPVELINKIFHLALGDETCSHLVQFLLVSPTWYNYLCMQPEFWSSLRVFSSPHPVQATKVIAHISKSRRYKLDIDISAPMLCETRFMQYIAHKEALYRLVLCPSQTVAPLIASGIDYHQLETLSLGSIKLDEDLVWCIENLPSLKSLCLKHISPQMVGLSTCIARAKLNTLKLIGHTIGGAVSPHLLQQIFIQTEPARIHLVNVIDSLEDISMVLNLETTKEFHFSPRYSSIMVSKMISTITSPLESLWIDSVMFKETKFQPPLPLRELKISNCKLGVSLCLGRLLQNYGCSETLERLELSATEVGRIIPFHLDPLPKLRYVRLNNMAVNTLIDGHLINWMNFFLPEIQVLDVGGCQVDMFEYIELVKKGLKVVRCDTLSKIDKRVLHWSSHHKIELVENPKSQRVRWEQEGREG